MGPTVRSLAGLLLLLLGMILAMTSMAGGGSLPARLARLFSSGPTDRPMLLAMGGMACFLAGLFLFFSRGPSGGRRRRGPTDPGEPSGTGNGGNGPLRGHRK